MTIDSIKSFIVIKYGNPQTDFVTFYTKCPHDVKRKWAERCMNDGETAFKGNDYLANSIINSFRKGMFYACVEEVVDAFVELEYEYISYEDRIFSKKYKQYKQWLFDELCRQEIENDH